jgi:chemotaxis signal transduction protein
MHAPSRLEATLRLAVVTIGAAQVGVAVDAVLHALPLAGALALLPRRRGALCGVVEHAGKLVPVVDLARWVDVAGAPAEGAPDAARILLLVDGGRRIGLRVDAVVGLAEVAARDLVRLHHDDDPDEVFHSVVKAHEPAVILSVLDVGRLVTLAMAWHQDDAPPAGAAADGAPVPDTAPVSSGPVSSVPVLYGLLQVGGVRLAAPVASLAEVLPMPAVQRAGFGIAHCLWRGRHVPVLPADALAQGERAAAPRLLAIIEHEGLALGVPVDAALGMQPFAPDADAPEQDGVAAIHYDADGNAVLLLDPARLLPRFPEAALSRKPANGAAAGATQAVNPTAHIVFEAAGLASTPIDAIEQVVPFGAADPDVPLADTMPWRGRAIAVRDLRPAGHGDAGQALIVRHGARHVACVVSHVRQLIPPREGRLYRIGAVEFISVGAEGQQASYRLLDLARLTA